MPVTPLGVWTPNDSDDWDIVTDLAAMGVSIDGAITGVANATIYKAGLTSARPLASAVTEGYMWYATDTNVLWRHNGSAWELFGLGPFKSIQVSSNTTGTVAGTGTMQALTGIALSSAVTTGIPCRAKVTVSFQAYTTAAGSGYSIGVAGTGATTFTPVVGTANTIAYTASGVAQSMTMSASWFVNLNAGTTTLNVVGQATGAGSTRSIANMNMLIEPVSE